MSYQHVIVTLDVAKWTYAAATVFKRTETLSKSIPNIMQSEKNYNVILLFKRGLRKIDLKKMKIGTRHVLTS